jgi:hypothetical protein
MRDNRSAISPVIQVVQKPVPKKKERKKGKKECRINQGVEQIV